MLRIIGATDKGLVRYVNEDRYAGEVFSPELAYGVVCDGMGGENAGGVASAIACEEIRRMLESSCRPGMDQRSVYMTLESAVATANAMVYDKAEQDPESMRGMGTTVCLAVVVGETAYIAHVGDSRAYLLRDGELERLTTDHTLARMLLDQGELTPEELLHHPDKGRLTSSLTRAVGVGPRAEADYASCPLRPGDILLLCSDGLYNMLDPVTLRECLRQAVFRDDARCLVDAANSRGGKDNITAVILTSQCEENENG